MSHVGCAWTFFTGKNKIAPTLCEKDDALPSPQFRGKSLRFDEIVTIAETYSKKEYDRRVEPSFSMTPLMAYLIRRELNEVKREMEIHDESRHFTHFYA
ncbi:hypothetical protein PSACC_00235 [Paramicrosporidium saccamoebae]|uniref:Uncharacterized protein n=1 Tax=Paramicrosporidium saccamoebae TaxID=1246581 RepID=A0A2H9TQB9_9FUNG|nr:hypothetical protein PSACC_00235 [Paramicrosporidium saccamoebae]